MNKTNMIIEAIHRLEWLKTNKGLLPQVVSDYCDGLVHCSERVKMGDNVIGALYYMNDLGGCPKEVQDKVKEIEEEYNVIVYHATHEWTSFGELWDLWCICEEDVNSDYRLNDFKDGYQFSYVYNVTDDACSEFGAIAYKPAGGGMLRVG